MRLGLLRRLSVQPRFPTREPPRPPPLAQPSSSTTQPDLRDLFEVAPTLALKRLGASNSTLGRELTMQISNAARYGMLSHAQRTALSDALVLDGPSQKLAFELDKQLAVALGNPAVRIANLNERLTHGALSPSARRSAERELRLLERLLEQRSPVVP